MKMPLGDPDFIPSGTVRSEILSPFLFFFNHSKINKQQNKTPNRNKLTTLKLKQKLIAELLSLGLEVDCVVSLTRDSRSLMLFHPE